ncbi:MAG: hypothetical protein GF384_03945 [Elusimicrobia bacterium]|nr:hypothetical protein [Elusimicrobiota bacterium]
MRALFLIFILYNLSACAYFAKTPVMLKTGKITIGDKVKDLETGKTTTMVKSIYNNEFCHKSIISPDGMMIASISSVWDVDEPIFFFRITEINDNKKIKGINSSDFISFDWSPDSHYVALENKEYQTNSSEFFILNVKNSVEMWKVNISSPSIELLSIEMWSQTGENIYFSGFSNNNETDNNKQLFRYNLLTGSLKQIGNNPDMLDVAVAYNESLIAYRQIKVKREESADQKTVFLSNLKDSVYLMDMNGENKELLINANTSNHSIFWSPDSTWVGYWKMPNFAWEKEEYFLHAINIDSKKRMSLYHKEKKTKEPHWWKYQEENPPNLVDILKNAKGLTRFQGNLYK